jgi:hypothetical protein
MDLATTHRTETRRPRRGRREVATIPAERRKHLLALALRRHAEWPVETVMRHFDVERRTVSLWCEKARGYPEAATREGLIEASGVREVAWAMFGSLN